MDFKVTLMQVGNSVGVSVPRALRDKYGFKKGNKVVLEEREEGLLLRSGKTKSKDFKKWWGEFIEENGEILDELKVR